MAASPLAAEYTDRELVTKTLWPKLNAKKPGRSEYEDMKQAGCAEAVKEPAENASEKSAPAKHTLTETALAGSAEPAWRQIAKSIDELAVQTAITEKEK